MLNGFITTALGALVFFSPQTEPRLYEKISTREVDTQTISVHAENLSYNTYFVSENSFVAPIEVPEKPAEVVETKIVQKVTTKTSYPPVASSELASMVDKYAAQYGARGDIMKIIMSCESGNRPQATNGSFAGLYQFMASTWVSNRNAMGLDPNPSLRYNAEEAIKTAAFKMGRDGYGAWPACSKKAFNLIAVN